ncbi:MAG: hypothetical protein GY936_14310 [Ignavibacteriae bacterium]|nr:hypothetical protein [Ignavibacteriota bacterium]
MKKGKKKVIANIQDFSVDISSFGSPVFTYTFTTRKEISTETLECYVEIDVPETLAEFRDLHEYSKEDLLEWLNENYE